MWSIWPFYIINHDKQLDFKEERETGEMQKGICHSKGAKLAESTGCIAMSIFDGYTQDSY